MKLGKYTMRCVKASQLEVNEISCPRKGGRFRGTSIGRDAEGYFATTHRARSRSYQDTRSIPQKTIDFIESTG